jgi:hypothetical protein
MTHSFSFERSSEVSAVRIGHWWPQMLSASVVGVIVLRFNSTAPNAVYVPAVLGLVAFVLATWMLMRRHDRQLCETCVASIPLNVQEQSVRFRRRFSVAHAGANRKAVAAYLIVLIGSNALIAFSWGQWPWAAIQATMIYLILSQSTHRRLQPWCPFCAGGDGGDEHDAVEPDAPRGRERELV